LLNSFLCWNGLSYFFFYWFGLFAGVLLSVGGPEITNKIKKDYEPTEKPLLRKGLRTKIFFTIIGYKK
jgi:hypothetical protein